MNRTLVLEEFCSFTSLMEGKKCKKKLSVATSILIVPDSFPIQHNLRNSVSYAESYKFTYLPSTYKHRPMQQYYSQKTAKQKWSSVIIKSQ